MHRVSIGLTILAVLLAAACTGRVYRQTGLDMPVMPQSAGVTTLSATAANDIVVTGEVQLDSGVLNVELLNPAGVVVKQWTFSANQRHAIGLKVTATAGAWQLKYASQAGTGKIQIAMSQEQR